MKKEIKMNDLSKKIEEVITNYATYMGVDPLMIEAYWVGEALEVLEEVLDVLKNKK